MCTMGQREILLPPPKSSRASPRAPQGCMSYSLPPPKYTHASRAPQGSVSYSLHRLKVRASRTPRGSVSSFLHRGHKRHLQTLLPEKLFLTCVIVHCLLRQSGKYISRNLSFKRVSVNPVLEFVAHRLSSPDNQAS